MRAGIFILESRRDLGRLYEMAPVRIGSGFGEPGGSHQEFPGGGPSGGQEQDVNHVIITISSLRI